MNLSVNLSEVEEQYLNHSYLSNSEDVAINLYNCYLYLMIILGLSGNCVVLFVFYKLPPSATADWFIFSITLCDLATSVINVPIYVSFTNGLWKYFGSNVACKLHMTLSQSFVLSSVFLICGLAADRYFKICKPLTSYPVKRARNICVLISMVTFLLSLPCIFMWENKEMHCKLASNGYGVFAYYFFVFLTFAFATSVVVVSYSKVLQKVRGRRHIFSRRNQLVVAPNSCKVVPVAAKRMKVNKIAPLPRLSHEDPTVPGVIFERTHYQLHIGDALKESPRSIENAVENTRIVTTRERYNTETTKSSNLSSVSTDEKVRPQIQITRQQSIEKQTTKISFLVCTIFIVTWIPPWASFFLFAVPGMKNNDTAIKIIMFGRMTHLINTVTNPVLYVWLNRKFRKKTLELLRCLK